MVTTHASNGNIAIIIIIITVITINITIIFCDVHKVFCCILQTNKHYIYPLSLQHYHDFISILLYHYNVFTKNLL